ncbi:MAG: MBL fold metallo-hydrolase [Tannerella sp.]|jgi:glyoxylase-like metal-dependent hydrolase (beta-lactamase superfamily II)|nr:MBL fold metallo-hydrolase [Tannerella sp.]
MMTIKQFVFNFVSVNTYLLYDETREALLIDCGCMTRGEETALSSFISDSNLILKRLLNTHCHFDHILGDSFIYKTYGIKPECHRDECGAGVPSISKQAASFGIFKEFEDIEPEHFIEAGDEIRFGNSVLKALLVPGHSPASLAFYSAADGVVFTGDALFQTDIGRTDLWGGDHNTLVSSIKSQLLTLPDNTVVYPGHGPATTIGYERMHNEYLA